MRQRLRAAILRRELALPARRVRQQMPDRDVARGRGLLHREVRQVPCEPARPRSSLPCSTSRMIAVAVTVLEMDASGKDRFGRDGLRVVEVGDAKSAHGASRRF